VYAVGGGRDVLILAPDLFLPNLKAVARRPGQLTKEDKLKLLSQGGLPDCQDEVTIVRARHELDKNQKIVEVKSRQSLTRKEVMKSIAHLLFTTKNDGGKNVQLAHTYRISAPKMRLLIPFAMHADSESWASQICHFPCSCNLLHWSW
jgi:hypothetical protein